jgi:hypothetical protein
MHDMSPKPGKTKNSAAPSRRSTGSPKPRLAVEDDERHRDDVDDYISRNRDALNSSIRKSRREIAEGKASLKTINTIIAEGRRRHLRQS